MPATRKDRRAPDPRLAELHAVVQANSPKIAKVVDDVQHLHDCVEALKLAVNENTEITKQVADIMATFKVTLAIGKWVAAIGAAVTATTAAIRGWKP